MFFVKRSLKHVRNLYIDDLTSKKMTASSGGSAWGAVSGEGVGLVGGMKETEKVFWGFLGEEM